VIFVRLHTAIRDIGSLPRDRRASLVAGSTDIQAHSAIAACSAISPNLREPWSGTAPAARAVGVRIGALLAVAGVLLQALFRNPLADSYVLGVSGGASLGALLALLIGSRLWLVQSRRHGADAGHPAGAGAGARRRHGARTADRRGRASACGALVTLVLVLADNGQLRGMMFWLAGDLGWAARPGPWRARLVSHACVSLIARPLDVLATGETTAQSLGLNLGRWRIVIVILAGLFTAGAVIQGGTIGFIGMVYRTWCGSPSARRCTAWWSRRGAGGGTLLAAADLVARTAAAPRQLPVGAIMALLGVPCSWCCCALRVRLETGRETGASYDV
jgi:iron complex transport system permease protein